MPFDPYWEWCKIPLDRRPPSHRELLGIGPDETDIKKIEEAAQRRREHVKQFVISPQEEVALDARRLLVEVGDAVAALRRSLTTPQAERQPKAVSREAETRSGTPNEPLLAPIILGPAKPAPPVTVIPPPLPVGGVVTDSEVPIPPPLTDGAWRVDTAGNVLQPGEREDALPPPGEPVFEVMLAPDGEMPPDTVGVVVPPQQPPATAGELLNRGGLDVGNPVLIPRLTRLRQAAFSTMRRLPASVSHLAVAGPRAALRGVRMTVRRIDGLLRFLAGAENAILHGFFRILAVAALGMALVYVVPPLAAGLARLASVRVASSDAPPPSEPKPPAGATGQKAVTNSLGMRLVLIPAGEFTMGSEDSEAMAYPDESPRHAVRISKPYYLAVLEVTVGQFRQFVDATGYRTDAERRGRQETWNSPGFQQTDGHPAAYVSWNDAVAFCGWLTRKENREYRLPTEAEWEYACGARGTPLVGPGGEPADVGQCAWWQENAEQRTHPVGGKHHNARGLYDTLGNVAEWCQDWYQSDFYAHREETDPHGPASGTYRVLRGGSATSSRENVRPAFRSCAAPDEGNLTGFRLVLVRAAENEPQDAGDNARSRWVCETYDTTIYRVQGKEWAEVDNKTRKIKWYLTETERSLEYVELWNTTRKETTRLSAQRGDLKRGDKWEWVSNGHWVSK